MGKKEFEDLNGHTVASSSYPWENMQSTQTDGFN